MIDTVVINLNMGDFEIKNHNKFSPSSEHMFVPPYYSLKGGGIVKCNYNIKSKTKYYPRLTLIKAVRKGGYTLFLRIEFSVSKLLFGNNFDEVEQKDFEQICRILFERLRNMGIYVKDLDAIKNSGVTTIHFSKNIILDNYKNPASIIKELYKTNICKKFDTNKADYRNEGHAYKYHTNEMEVIVYDKLKDLEKAKLSERRAIEMDNALQLNLFKKSKPKSPFEVIRLEIRFGTKKKIFQKIKDVYLEGFDNKKLSFENLFNRNLAHYFLKQEIKKIASLYPKLLLVEDESNESLLATLKLGNPQLSYRKLLSLIGLRVLLKEIDTREIKQYISKMFNDSVWYKLNKEMGELDVKTDNSFFLTPMIRAIDEFKPVKLENYKGTVAEVTEESLNKALERFLD